MDKHGLSFEQEAQQWATYLILQALVDYPGLPTRDQLAQYLPTDVFAPSFWQRCLNQLLEDKLLLLTPYEETLTPSPKGWRQFKQKGALPVKVVSIPQEDLPQVERLDPPITAFDPPDNSEDVFGPPRSLPVKPPPEAPKALKVRPSLSPAQEQLLESLRQVRGFWARRSELPSYCVCRTDCLYDMALNLPTDEAGLRAIKGIGEVFIEKYSAAFLEVIAQHVLTTDSPPTRHPDDMISRLNPPAIINQ